MRVVAVLLLMALHFGACADAVDPTLGTEQAFSLYGFLDPTASRQALRVVPIVGAIDGDTLSALPVEVTSVERGTGRTASWRDSAFTFRDGSTGHVFVADYTPTPGETVEVRVEETTGERRVTRVEVEVAPLQRPVLGTVLTTGAAVTYPIQIQAPRVLTTELVFRVVGLAEAPLDTVAVPFADVAPFTDVGGGMWGLDLDFLPTARAFLASPQVRGATLRLVDVTARVFVTGPQWAVPPAGLDEDRIIEPGTFSNVTGGFGFVGSGFWASTRWTPSLATQSRAGFLVEADPASVLTINEVSGGGWVELYNPTPETLPIGGYRVAVGADRATIPAGQSIAGFGFTVVRVAATLQRGPVVLESLSGVPLVDLDVGALPDDPDVFSFGSYPDGRSRQIGEFAQYRDFDLFRGLIAPTPGAPNRPVSHISVANEVFTTGADGWVETINRLGIRSVLVTDDPDRTLSEWVQARRVGDFWVADETPGRLVLDQLGGEVVVVVLRNKNPPRVYDVRPYGPQVPGQSSGLLPDGERANWTEGLRPTPGAANALARFGL